MSEQTQDVDETDDGAGLRAQMVIGWGGQVTAVWYRPDAEQGFADGQLFASVRDVDGAWSEPVPVSKTFAFRSSRFDAAAGHGQAVSVVWTARFEGAPHVFEAHRDELGWSSPFMIGRGRDPRVVMDGLGNTTVLWHHRGLQLVTRTPEGVWSARRGFSSLGISYAANLEGNRAGDEALLNLSTDGLRAAFRDRASQKWSRAVSVTGEFARGVGLAVDPGGRVLAAWSTARDIWWARRSLEGRWSPAQKIAGDVGWIGEYGWVDLSFNRRGRGLIQWVAENNDTYVARYRPGHGFQRAVRLGRDRHPSFAAWGSPLLTAGGTAAVAGTMGDRVAYRWQAAGEPWSAVQRLNAMQALNAVGTRGTLIAFLFQQEGLRARVIDFGEASEVPPPGRFYSSALGGRAGED